MEAPEVPTEHLHEEMHERAHGGGWIMRVALTSALTAALAAVAALKAGHTANEAMLAQIESANQWNFFQSKSIKASVLRSKMDLLASMGKEPSPKDEAKAKEYEHDQEGIKTKAEELAQESRGLLKVHQTLSHSVTMFQISIAVSAMSVLSRKRTLWGVSLIFSGIGVVYLVLGYLALFAHH
jgi:hypothetical protein